MKAGLSGEAAYLPHGNGNSIMKILSLCCLSIIMINHSFAHARTENRLATSAEKLAVCLETAPFDWQKASEIADELEEHALELNTGSAAYSARAESINKKMRLALGVSLYNRIESAAIRFYESKNEDERCAAIIVLVKALRSNAIEKHLEEVLADAAATEEDNMPKASSWELYRSAEGLAYLGNTNSVDDLKSLIATAAMPWFIKQGAFEALADSMYKEIEKEICEYIESDDIVVALAALNAVGEKIFTNRTVAAAAAVQFKKTTDSYLENGRVNMHVQRVFTRLNLFLSDAFKAGVLSSEEILAIKENLAKVLLKNDSRVISNIASLFGRIADDNDGEMFQFLLQSEETRMMETACVGLVRCSASVIRANKDRLWEIVENKTGRLQRYAFIALRKGLGEKVEISVPHMNEFFDHLDRVKKAYSEGD